MEIRPIANKSIIFCFLCVQIKILQLGGVGVGGVEMTQIAEKHLKPHTPTDTSPQASVSLGKGPQ